jgi:hypothetical protein
MWRCRRPVRHRVSTKIETCGGVLCTVFCVLCCGNCTVRCADVDEESHSHDLFVRLLFLIHSLQLMTINDDVCGNFTAQPTRNAIYVFIMGRHVPVFPPKIRSAARQAREERSPARSTVDVRAAGAPQPCKLGRQGQSRTQRACYHVTAAPNAVLVGSLLLSACVESHIA